MSRNWVKGSTSRWRRIRAAVLAANLRDNGGRCTLAIPQICTGQATQVHHTLGRAVTGDNPKYLVACCAACNLKVGQPKRYSPRPKRISNW